MPLVSQFYGILIYIYKEINSKHHMPHFHAKYAEFEGVYDFKANLIEGELPVKQRKLVEAWTLLHEDELNAAANFVGEGCMERERRGNKD